MGSERSNATVGLVPFFLLANTINPLKYCDFRRESGECSHVILRPHYCQAANITRDLLNLYFGFLITDS
jgi:hypothetical protein